MASVLENLIQKYQYKMLNILNETSVNVLPVSPALFFDRKELF